MGFSRVILPRGNLTQTTPNSGSPPAMRSCLRPM